jgi:hypothetical protein
MSNFLFYLILFIFPNYTYADRVEILGHISLIGEKGYKVFQNEIKKIHSKEVFIDKNENINFEDVPSVKPDFLGNWQIWGNREDNKKPYSVTVMAKFDGYILIDNYIKKDCVASSSRCTVNIELRTIENASNYKFNVCVQQYKNASKQNKLQGDYLLKQSLSCLRNLEDFNQELIQKQIGDILSTLDEFDECINTYKAVAKMEKKKSFVQYQKYSLYSLDCNFRKFEKIKTVDQNWLDLADDIFLLIKESNKKYKTEGKKNLGSINSKLIRMWLDALLYNFSPKSDLSETAKNIFLDKKLLKNFNYLYFSYFRNEDQDFQYANAGEVYKRFVKLLSQYRTVIGNNQIAKLNIES